MKIAGSIISMAAQHSLAKVIAKRESVRIWVDATEPLSTRARLAAALPGSAPVGSATGSAALPVGVGATLKPAQRDSRRHVVAATHSDDLIAPDLPAEYRQKILLLEAMLRALTGRDVKIRIKEVEPQRDSTGAAVLRDREPLREQARQGWGLEYDYHESYKENETLSFAAHGLVKTADGREIGFELHLLLNREFAVETGISIRAGDARLSDPLVINYDGSAAELEGARMSFDLDADGAAEQIPFVSAGSGFLALDSNGDNVVNDGRELFGPATGNAFAELAAHDLDDNRWIDEGDPVFDRLRLWTRDAKGTGFLLSLRQVGIGAIHLGSADAPFSVRGPANDPLAENRRAGVFVRENGTAGTVQQLDLVV